MALTILPMYGHTEAPPSVNVFDALDSTGQRLLKEHTGEIYNDLFIDKIIHGVDEQMRDLYRRRIVMGYAIGQRRLPKNGFIIEVTYQHASSRQEMVHLTYACVDKPGYISFVATTL